MRTIRRGAATSPRTVTGASKRTRVDTAPSAERAPIMAANVTARRIDAV
jgi:hypothetical protein